MKVYLLYLKKDKVLYAFTATKEYYEAFLEQRNPKCFIVKKEKMDDIEFSHFSYLHRGCQIIQDVLETKDKTLPFMVTQSESSEFEACLEEIERKVDSITSIFNKYPLKKKYQKAINHLTRIEDGKGHLLLDTLSIFVDYNIDTFMIK